MSEQYDEADEARLIATWTDHALRVVYRHTEACNPADTTVRDKGLRLMEAEAKKRMLSLKRAVQ